MNIQKAIAFGVFAGSMIANTAFAQQITGASIEQRKDNQQQRIAQGVKSGQLTAGETANLEKREASINHEEQAMRQADNGKLTKEDKKLLTQRQNRVSKSIYSKKHNGFRQG